MVPQILLYKKNHDNYAGPASAGRRLMGTALILMILCLTFFLSGPVRAFASSEEEPEWDVNGNRIATVTVENGSVKGEPYIDLATMTIGEKGKYRISLSWLPEGVTEEEFHKYAAEVASGKNATLKGTPGFLTVLVLMDEDGRVVYSTNAGCITFDTVMMLEPGDYTLRALFAANTSEYEAIATEYLCSERDVASWVDESGVDTVAKDGTYRMSYDTGITNERSIGNKYQVGLYVGFAVGIVVAMLILVIMAIVTNKENRVGKMKYDERQLLARGKAATYAFFTMLFLVFAVGLADSVGIFGEFFNTNAVFFYLAAALIGIGVYAFFCIKNDAYIALNERQGVVLIVLMIIGLYNGFLFCTDLFFGKLLVDGVLSMKTANGLAAVCSVFVIVVLLVKKFLSSSGKDQDDDEEEDDE